MSTANLETSAALGVHPVNLLSPASTSSAHDSPATSHLRRHWHLWVLLGITVFGGFLRFLNLTNPPLWGDEGYTFHRVSTDYRDLLDKLQTDGFTPLHYEFYWWM